MSNVGGTALQTVTLGGYTRQDSCNGCLKFKTCYSNYQVKYGACQTCGRSNEVFNSGSWVCSEACAKVAAGGCPREVYNKVCGKSEGTRVYERVVDTYKCGTCGATSTIYRGASSGQCPYCNEQHGVAESGAVSHNKVNRLICGR